ncbi:hypothetical protein EWH99_02575 [Sporolactobacillus sp. THM7-7]|nr:hypothetical protein EWH99_02575 [Sporolactobacillus sp. THM7-7]
MGKRKLTVTTLTLVLAALFSVLMIDKSTVESDEQSVKRSSIAERNQGESVRSEGSKTENEIYRQQGLVNPKFEAFINGRYSSGVVQKSALHEKIVKDPSSLIKNRTTEEDSKSTGPSNTIVSELKTKKEKARQPRPSKIVLDAPVVRQFPELQKGCEVTALAMLLQFAGKKTDKMKLAEQIDKVPYRSGVFRGNPHEGFVGNMYTFSEPGFGVFHEPVFRLAKKYLGESAVDLSGRLWPAVEEQIQKKRPVWAIVTSNYGYVPKSQWMTWETKEGTMQITFREHAVLITGFDKQHVYVNDPLDGGKNKKLNKKNFISGWKQFGNQAISYH